MNPNARGGGIVVVMDGTRKQLSVRPTTIAGMVRVCFHTSAGRTITFGDYASDLETLADGDAIVLEHPDGVDFSAWYCNGTAPDFVAIIQGGGF